MLFCPGVPRVIPVSALHGFMNSGPYQSEPTMNGAIAATITASQLTFAMSTAASARSRWR
jgi:hypothetical protein